MRVEILRLPVASAAEVTALDSPDDAQLLEQRHPAVESREIEGQVSPAVVAGPDEFQDRSDDHVLTMVSHAPSVSFEHLPIRLAPLFESMGAGDVTCGEPIGEIKRALIRQSDRMDLYAQGNFGRAGICLDLDGPGIRSRGCSLRHEYSEPDRLALAGLD